MFFEFILFSFNPFNIINHLPGYVKQQQGFLNNFPPYNQIYYNWNEICYHII